MRNQATSLDDSFGLHGLGVLKLLKKVLKCKLFLLIAKRAMLLIRSFLFGRLLKVVFLIDILLW